LLSLLAWLWVDVIQMRVLQWLKRSWDLHQTGTIAVSFTYLLPGSFKAKFYVKAVADGGVLAKSMH